MLKNFFEQVSLSRERVCTRLIYVRYNDRSGIIIRMRVATVGILMENVFLFLTKQIRDFLRTYSKYSDTLSTRDIRSSQSYYLSRHDCGIVAHTFYMAKAMSA